MNGHFDLGAITPGRYFFGIASLLGLVFTFIGNEDSTNNLVFELFRWQLQAIGPMACLIISHVGINRLNLLSHLNPWVQVVISGVFGVLLFSPLSLGIDLWLASEYGPASDIYGEWVNELGSMGPPVIICWLGLNAPWILGFRFEQVSNDVTELNYGDSAKVDNDNGDHQQSSEDINEKQSNGLAALIPSSISSEIIYLKSELHYLLVVTELGQALVLYNLKDAADEMGKQGMLTHRSYWVSFKWVKSIQKKGRQGVFILKNGSQIPVSRNKLSEARMRFEGFSN